MIFDAGLGEPFVVRVAGAIATSPIILGSLQYAVSHFGEPGPDACNLLLVLGHERCGAVHVAVETIIEHGERPGGFIADIVEAIRPAIEASASALGDPVDNAVCANGVRVAEILSDVPILAEVVDAGARAIVAARYDRGSGRVTLLG